MEARIKDKIHRQYSEKNFPLFFDLRNSGKVTPVKDQGRYGTCWSFAALASVESVLMPAERHDFSERSLATHTGFDWGDMSKGNQWIAAEKINNKNFKIGGIISSFGIGYAF